MSSAEQGTDDAAPDSKEPSVSETATEVAYSGALFQAYFATGLEQTKSVLLLASAGVGLSMMLLFGGNAKGLESWVPVWLLLSTVSFGASALLCIWVFQANGKLVQRLVDEEDEAAEDALVGRIHLASLLVFSAGMCFLVFSGVAQVWL